VANVWFYAVELMLVILGTTFVIFSYGVN